MTSNDLPTTAMPETPASGPSAPAASESAIPSAAPAPVVERPPGHNARQRGRGKQTRGATQAPPGAAPGKRAEREVHPLLEKLAALYPHLFGARFLPLQRGVYEELLARHPEALPAEELKVALGLHARSGRYLQAIAERHPRHSLDGAVVEPMAPEHVHHAIVELHRRRQSRTQEDLRPRLVARLVDAVQASGLDRATYTAQVRVSKPDALSLLDEVFAQVGERTARREALRRAFDASGQPSVEAFAEMYGVDLREARQLLAP